MWRRSFIQSLGALACLPRFLAGSPEFLRGDRALILLWMDGGMSHLDTFDGKPEAPVAIRGDLPSMESALEGVFVSAELDRIAAMMDRCALVRSLTSPEGNHDRGSHHVLTGRRPSPVLRYPSFGSVLGAMFVSSNPMPPYVAIPDAHPYAKQGFLPAAQAPFEIHGQPGRSHFKVKDLESSVPMDRALALLKALDEIDGPPRSASEAARDEFLERARYVSATPEVRERFDLKKESASMHQRYGRHFLGQSCLLARRLVEGGVRSVFVRYKGWDHHRSIAKELTYGFPPKLEALNQAVPALYRDLEERGMLEKTTVLLASEFGRTPRLNPSGGRDHWSRASSALLFGAGIRRGAVFGKTDARGEEPIEDAVSPADLFHTVMAALGMDLEKIWETPDGRPVRLVEEEAQLIRPLLAS